ncbi:MAG: hypothetical protein FGM32_11185 [Candidatus Kapabacteria bacterium]|nr:hypothetical protein [Candidatus Kapabacteria bacterium]
MGIFNVLVIMMSVASCSKESAGPVTPTCPEPEPRMAGSIRVAGFAYMVVDMADDKTSLLVRDYSRQLIVVGVQNNERLYTLEVPDLLPSDETFWTLAGSGFLGHSSDSIFASCLVRRSNGDTASRNYVVNIRTGSVSEIRPSRCLENGWDPVLKSWFYVYSIERLPNRTLLVSTNDLRYDYANDTFLDEEISDPRGGHLYFYKRTWLSGYLVGRSGWFRGPGQDSISLVVDGKSFEMSQLVSDMYVQSSIRGTDYVILDVIPNRYASSSGKGWGPELWVVDVGRLLRDKSISNAIVVKRNLHEAYCSLATLGLYAYAYDLDHVYISMHQDGEYVQIPFRISLSSPTFKSPITFR